MPDSPKPTKPRVPHRYALHRGTTMPYLESQSTVNLKMQQSDSLALRCASSIDLLYSVIETSECSCTTDNNATTTTTTTSITSSAITPTTTISSPARRQVLMM